MKTDYLRLFYLIFTPEATEMKTDCLTLFCAIFPITIVVCLGFLIPDFQPSPIMTIVLYAVVAVSLVITMLVIKKAVDIDVFRRVVTDVVLLCSGFCLCWYVEITRSQYVDPVSNYYILYPAIFIISVALAFMAGDMLKVMGVNRKHVTTN